MTSTRSLSTPVPLASREVQSTTRQEAIARVLGASSLTNLDWRRLLCDGVLIRLHVRRCSFTARLTLLDLGITVEDEQVRSSLSRLLILGEKRLLPERYMKSLSRLESAARSLLRQRAFRTELGAFVPSTAYRSWREETEQLAEEYFSLRDEILSNYRLLVQETLAEYEILARDTYRRLRASHPELAASTEIQFVTEYCNRIGAHIPTPERIRSSFDFQAPRLSPIAQIEALQRAESEGESSGVEPSQVRREHQAQERDRALMLSDLRQQARSQMQNTLDTVLTSLAGQIRGLIYETVTDVLATMQKRGGESLAPRSLVQLKNLMEQIRHLNFYGDSEVEQMLRRVGLFVELSPAQRERSGEEIARQLRSIATLTRATLLDLEQEPRSARQFCVPDIPTVSLVREARRELGLESLALPTDIPRAREERPSRLPDGEQPLGWQKALLPF